MVFLSRFFKILSSSRLALILVLSVILISVCGALLPQEGMFDPHDIILWQKTHSAVTSLLKPLGMFHAFHSIPFLIIISMLGVNTLTCTLKVFNKRGRFVSFRGTDAVKNTGFYFLHFCLIPLLAGGFWSSATQMNGHIVLTEGQSFREVHRQYLRISEGPLRAEKHRGFFFKLKQVVNRYEKKRFLVETTARIEFGQNPEMLKPIDIKYNYPSTLMGIDFTLEQTGFSPMILIREKKTGKTLVHSFLALKTHGRGQKVQYRDFLPLPFFKDRIIINLIPDYQRTGGKIRKIGEEPRNPIVIVEKEESTGKIVGAMELPLKGKIDLGDLTMEFTGLRQWASFKVVDDPGYFLILISFWLAVLALILRYIPDLRNWRGKNSSE